MTLYIGGGVYVYASAIDYWPVTAVTKPQHFWPFTDTGDYTDQGSTGGLGLTEQGTGNSFDANGLVLNGSGYAKWTGTDADINNLGNTFSLIIDFTLDAESSGYKGLIGSGANYDTSPFYGFADTPAGDWRSRTSDGATNVTCYGGTTPNGVRHQIIYTQSGADAVVYKNGTSAGTSGVMLTPDGTKSDLYIGYLLGVGWHFVGTIHHIGILKGEAWSADDVAAIYAALS